MAAVVSVAVVLAAVVFAAVVFAAVVLAAVVSGALVSGAVVVSPSPSSHATKHDAHMMSARMSAKILVVAFIFSS